jgi:hypothetical protein
MDLIPYLFMSPPKKYADEPNRPAPRLLILFVQALPLGFLPHRTQPHHGQRKKTHQPRILALMAWNAVRFSLH